MINEVFIETKERMNKAISHCSSEISIIRTGRASTNLLDVIKENNKTILADPWRKPKDWENKTIPQFLEAIASWTEDMEGYYINNRLPIPININWKVIAEILMAAKMYE